MVGVFLETMEQLPNGIFLLVLAEQRSNGNLCGIRSANKKNDHNGTEHHVPSDKMTKSLKLSVCTFELVKMAQAKLEPNDASEQTLHFHPVPLLLKSPKFLKLKF